MAKSGAEIVIDVLIDKEVKYIFGIPGAKVDKIFDVLLDKGPELILTRHEQNAGFMASAVGRITGKPGVVVATSGPGTSNLATPLATASAENDPVVALVGNVSRADRLKHTHQAMDNVELMEPITKFSKEVVDQANIAETVSNAFRIANSGRKGASFVSLPQDILGDLSSPVPKLLSFDETVNVGPANTQSINNLQEALKSANLPVFLLGMRSSSVEVTKSLRKLFAITNIPVVETFQAAGVVSRELEHLFFGRVGLFSNQPGDTLLSAADLVITIGYDPIEYDCKIWNSKQKAKIFNIDEIPADIDNFFQPTDELIGGIVQTIEKLTRRYKEHESIDWIKKNKAFLTSLTKKLAEDEKSFTYEKSKDLIHPIYFIKTLRSLIDDKMIVAVDVGSVYIWIARYFRSYEPRTLLFSNGMQTLGVALPWAIAASLVKNKEKVVSISGDGGFLFSSMELETAVRLKLPIVHIIWNDGTYDMVAFQQKIKYHRTSGVNLGPIDYVKYAESFGAVGFKVTKSSELEEILRQSLTIDKPVIIDVAIDYSDNIRLAKAILDEEII